MAAAVRAALYLRVSTGRQADSDLSIPDQRRQAKGYCASRDWEIVADYVEPGASATDDRRPEFQSMIDAATTKPRAFDMIVVHSFSRFFRDQFQLEFYVRRLAKNGVRLVSITQELGGDPMSNMIRQIMALFDEYQSKENAKHTLRAMKENARQGFWNGALAPIGYRTVEAAEQRGHRTKKTLEIDPIQAETVRPIFRLAREGNGSLGPMGVKSIAKHLNESGIRTSDGGRWGVDAVHKVLTRTTYIGRHRFNTKYWKTRERKPEAEVVEMAAPPIIDVAEFPARRSGRERGSHYGIEKCAPAHACRGFKRKNGRFWSAQFCTEVARSERFELPTLGFEVRCSIQLSYEREWARLADLAREGYPRNAIQTPRWAARVSGSAHR